MSSPGNPNADNPALRPWPLEWMPIFLLTMRTSGNISQGCAAAGVSRSTALGWRRKFPRFAEAWNEALEDAIDVLEGEAWRRALAGSDMLLWKLLSARRKDYAEKIEVSVTVQQKVRELASQFNLKEDDILAEVDAILSGTSSTQLEANLQENVVDAG